MALAGAPRMAKCEQNVWRRMCTFPVASSPARRGAPMGNSQNENFRFFRREGGPGHSRLRTDREDRWSRRRRQDSRMITSLAASLMAHFGRAQPVLTEPCSVVAGRVYAPGYRRVWRAYELERQQLGR
jgi:hypothetical protein